MKQAKELDPMGWFKKVLSILITKHLFITRIDMAYKKLGHECSVGKMLPWCVSRFVL